MKVEEISDNSQPLTRNCTILTYQINNLQLDLLKDILSSNRSKRKSILI